MQASQGRDAADSLMGGLAGDDVAGDCFILCTPDTVYAWFGGGTSASRASTTHRQQQQQRGHAEVPTGGCSDAVVPVWSVGGGQAPTPRRRRRL